MGYGTGWIATKEALDVLLPVCRSCCLLCMCQLLYSQQGKVRWRCGGHGVCVLKSKNNLKAKAMLMLAPSTFFTSWKIWQHGDRPPPSKTNKTNKTHKTKTLLHTHSCPPHICADRRRAAAQPVSKSLPH